MPSVGRRPFVGSGGHYSPGPANTPPLLAMSHPLDDALAPPWVLRRSSPVLGGEADSRQSLSLDAPADGFTRRPSLRARPPFTRHGPPFLGRVAELIRGRDVACRLLQRNHDVRAKPTGTLDPRREGGLDLLPFLDVPRLSLAEAVTRGEPRCVRPSDPSAGSSRSRGFAQP